MPDTDDTAAALRATVARLYRRLRAEAGDAEYTASQIAVLRRLETGPATTAELARAEDMRPQSMSAVITPLERAGIVERRSDPDDARAAQVSITAEGARIIGESRAAKQAWLDRMMSERLSTAERRTLREATALLERMLQP